MYYTYTKRFIRYAKELLDIRAVFRPNRLL